MRISIVVALVLFLSTFGACKSEGEKSGDSEAKESRGLYMSSDSAICKKSMQCCEARVKVEKGKVTPEDLNLMCSGVALAKTDKDCQAFMDGYVAVFELDKVDVPAECK